MTRSKLIFYIAEDILNIQMLLSDVSKKGLVQILVMIINVDLEYGIDFFMKWGYGI